MILKNVDENLQEEMGAIPIMVQSNIDELFINWDEIKADDDLSHITFPYKPFVINIIMNAVSNLDEYKDISMFIRRCTFDADKIVLSCPGNKRDELQELILQVLEIEQNNRKRSASSNEEEIPPKIQKI